ncbi:MAG: glycosyltransferase family 2 protein [Pseudoalteromonas sp.]|uniref:glycosyltransferase family 2 protein n=1 Tax=Pseudoalteromonas sp. TaxID=53249 RepID=UPI001D833666|nr:glycosyltransferase family 2 protein [Pseudoalteromonas sp.]NRA81646.1 glycosyltransferase family 2 protein [Pseudoalteromonas sp.]
MSKIGSDLVSIIMPAYNVGNFICESIESVINQSYDCWELLIVDDCSTDKTVLEVKSYQNDNRIKLFENKKNLGGAGCRNVAISNAKGRYIAFLDSDDLWEPKKLENQIRFMQKGNIGFSFSGYSLINEAGQFQGQLKAPTKVSFYKLLKHNYIGCLTVIYDTQPYGKIYMPLVRKRQDFALWLELLKRFDYAYGLQEYLGSYRIRLGSLSRNKLDAFKYYWRVLRDVGKCNHFSALYNLTCYLFIVYLKKKHTKIYHNLFID